MGDVAGHENLTGAQSGMNPGVDTDRLTPTQRRILDLVATGAAGRGVTASDIARSLGKHVNSVRDHLRALEDEGLIESRPARESGAGRPTLTYHSLVASGPTTDEFVALAASGVEIVGPDEARLRAWGRRWGQLASQEEHVETEARARVTAYMSRMGFAPLSTDDGIELRRCPLWAPDAPLDLGVCALHAGLLEELAGPDVELLPLVTPGTCLVALRAGQ